MLTLRRDSQFQKYHKNIFGEMTDKMNDVHNDLHDFGNLLLSEFEELEKIDFGELKKNINLMNERRGAKSAFSRIEYDSSREVVFRIHMIKTLIKKYEAGRDGNRNVGIVDAYEVLGRGKVKIDLDIKFFS